MEIKRILLYPDTVRRMVEPDFKKRRPDGCNDSIMLYATTEQTDYEPLRQTAIELSPHLSTRGIFHPDVCIIKRFDCDDFQSVTEAYSIKKDSKFLQHIEPMIYHLPVVTVLALVS